MNIYCLLDSGSESSIIGKDYKQKHFPNWESFPDYKDKPLGGRGVDGSEFTFLGTKLFTIKIGNVSLKVPMAIPNKAKGVIIGLDLFEMFPY